MGAARREQSAESRAQSAEGWSAASDTMGGGNLGKPLQESFVR